MEATILLSKDNEQDDAFLNGTPNRVYKVMWMHSLGRAANYTMSVEGAFP